MQSLKIMAIVSVAASTFVANIDRAKAGAVSEWIQAGCQSVRTSVLNAVGEQLKAKLGASKIVSYSPGEYVPSGTCIWFANNAGYEQVTVEIQGNQRNFDLFWGPGELVYFGYQKKDRYNSLGDVIGCDLSIYTNESERDVFYQMEIYNPTTKVQIASISRKDLKLPYGIVAQKYFPGCR